LQILNHLYIADQKRADAKKADDSADERPKKKKSATNGKAKSKR
jgi:hypothetical protein